MVGSLFAIASAVNVAIAMVAMRKLGLSVNFLVSPFFWAICGIIFSPFIIGFKMVIYKSITIYSASLIKNLLLIGVFTSIG